MLFAMGWFFLRQAFGETELPGWRGMPGTYYRDALMIGVGGTGALLALSRVTEWGVKSLADTASSAERGVWIRLRFVRSGNRDSCGRGFARLAVYRADCGGRGVRCGAL